MIKAILMDLGKTIITNEFFSFTKGLEAVYHTIHSSTVTLETYLAKANSITLYKNRNKDNVEIPLPFYLETLNKSFNLSYTNYESLEDTFLKSSTVEHPIKDVEKFLMTINKLNIPIIIVSNSTFTGRALTKQLQDLKLWSYFTSLISSADVLIRKPDSRIFIEGIKAIQKRFPFIQSNEIGFIGNDYAIDMVGSASVGLKPIWFNENKEDDYKNITFLNAFSYLELIDKIKRLVS